MSQEPYIARDTKEPLVVFGGYRVAKDGGLIRQPINMKATLPQATEADKALLGKTSVKEMCGERLESRQQSICCPGKTAY